MDSIEQVILDEDSDFSDHENENHLVESDSDEILEEETDQERSEDKLSDDETDEEVSDQEEIDDELSDDETDQDETDQEGTDDELNLDEALEETTIELIYHDIQKMKSEMKEVKKELNNLNRSWTHMVQGTVSSIISSITDIAILAALIYIITK